MGKKGRTRFSFSAVFASLSTIWFSEYSRISLYKGEWQFFVYILYSNTFCLKTVLSVFSDIEGAVNKFAYNLWSKHPEEVGLTIEAPVGHIACLEDDWLTDWLTILEETIVARVSRVWPRRGKGLVPSVSSGPQRKQNILGYADHLVIK